MATSIASKLRTIKKAENPSRLSRRRKTDDPHPLPQTIRERAPEIGREQAHQLHLRHQQADVPGRKRQRLEIEPEIRRKRADEGEIEEVVAGKTPVGQIMHPAILPDASDDTGSDRISAVLVCDQHSVHLVLEPNALLLHVLDGEIVDRQVFFFEPLDLSGQLMVLVIQVPNCSLAVFSE
jgi:hypothetical protein